MYPNIKAYNKRAVLPIFVKRANYEIEHLKSVLIEVNTLTIDVNCPL